MQASTIPALRKLRLKGHKLKVRLGCMESGKEEGRVLRERGGKGEMKTRKEI